MKCEYFDNNVCRLATQLAQSPVTVDPSSHCHVCQARHAAVSPDRPGTVCASLAIVQIRKQHDKTKAERLIAPLRQHCTVTPHVSRPSQTGPGTELQKLWSDVPGCQQCNDLAEKMNAWGVAGCREHFEEIVEDILPRARKWLEAEKPWIHNILGKVKLEDKALRFRIARDVTKAIEIAESRQPAEALAEPQSRREIREPDDGEWNAWLRSGGTLTLSESQCPRAISHPPQATRRPPSANVLLILSPRQLDPCIDSLARLPVDQVWFRAMTEPELSDYLNRFVATTHYENYLLAADDLESEPEVLALIEKLLEEHEAVTGWCRIAHDSPYANVTRAPLNVPRNRMPKMQDYSFYKVSEIERKPEGTFPTWFAGWTLTGFRRELWLQHPFRVNRFSGGQSDFETSAALNRKMISHTAARCEHDKAQLNRPQKQNWLIGESEPHLLYRRYDPETDTHDQPAPYVP